MKNNHRSIFPLLWLILFDQMSLNIAFPVLTLLFFDTHTSLFAPNTSHAVRSLWYGLCVALPHVINIIATPILSALSDEFGRRKILFTATLGAFIFSVTAAAGIYFGLLSLLFLGRFIQGVFSRTNPIAQAVIGDIGDTHNKVTYMGYLQTAISIGAFIGPVLGGYFANRFFFAKLNFSLPYILAAIFATISCLLTAFVFQETLAEKKIHSPWSEFNWQSIKKVFSNSQVICISVLLLLSQISWSIYYQYIPPILKTRLNFSADQLGLFVGMIAFWLALATTFGIRFLQQFFNLAEILILSIYLVAIGLIMTVTICWLNLSPHLNFLIWIAAIPIAVGDVIAYSCISALYSDVVSRQEQGKVMGVCFIIIALIWALTGVFGGVLMSVSGLLPLIVAPLGVICALAFMHSKYGNRVITIHHVNKP